MKQLKNYNNKKLVWRVDQATRSGHKLVRYMDGASETMTYIKAKQIIREVK